jgi:hypothetical protein
MAVRIFCLASMIGFPALLLVVGRASLAYVRDLDQLTS